MCGRFTITVNKFELIDAFQLSFFPEDYQPSFNVAPSQLILAAVQSETGRRAGFLQWGLIPSWVKEPKKWKPLINARGETVSERSSFKHLLNKKRCIIFADSFYEWKQESGKKVPYRIMRKDEKPFAFAGLWDRNITENNRFVTCTIITTEANESVQNVHDRMPVILNGNEAVEAWINNNDFTYDQAKKYIQPLSDDQIKLYEVSSLVNSPKNNVVDCIQPLAMY